MPPTRPVLHYQSRLSAIGETQQCGRAFLEVLHLTSGRVCVTVSGDVDATNRQALGLFVERHTRASAQLILDLSAVDFFGSQGFTALHYVSVHCARRDVDWTIIGNRGVRRILCICDPEAELPVVDSLGAAAQKLDRCAKYRRNTSWTRVRADDSTSVARTHRPSAVLQDRPSPGDRNARTGDVAALVGGQKDIHRRKLGGLARPAQRGVLAERGDLLRRHG